MRTLEEIEKEIAETKSELENLHGSETEVYARIVGYYRAVRNWNKGKRDEFSQRKMFNIENLDKNQYVLTQADSTLENIKIETRIAEEIYPKTVQKTDSSEGYYEIYTRKTCPNCPPVKDYMENINLSGKAIDVDTDEGLAEAAEKGVFAAPTVIVYDKNGKETARGHNVSELEEIFEKIAVGA